MIKAYLIIDESGAKGYSNNKEKSECELGVMAGYLIEESAIDEIRKNSKGYFQNTDSSTKMHITNLPNDKQEENRNRLYNLCISNHLSWIYNAIYVKGFSNANKESSSKKLLHEELFKGIFIKAVSLVYETYKDKSIHIEVITDTVDKTILQKFNLSLDGVIKMITNKEIVKIMKKPNAKTKKSELYKIITNVEFDSSVITFESLTYNVTCENSSLTVIADILANTAYYFLQKEAIANKNIALNSIHAIKNHPLSGLVYGCSDKDKNIFDIMYRRDYDKK